MATVKYKVLAYVEGEKEPFRQTSFTNSKDYQVEETVEEVAEFINDTWDEAQEEEGYEG